MISAAVAMSPVARWLAISAKARSAAGTPSAAASFIAAWRSVTRAGSTSSTAKTRTRTTPRAAARLLGSSFRAEAIAASASATPRGPPL